MKRMNVIVVVLVMTVLSTLWFVGCSTDYRHQRYNAMKVGPGYLPSTILPAERGLNRGGPLPLVGEPLARDEEVWVIQRPEPQANAPREKLPGSGALLAKMPNEPEPVPVPLKHTDVQASIAGYVATVDVRQEYHNPYDAKIEAVYVFPLPENAAVNEFVMTVGERKIRGIIREREEAQRIYQEAKHQGYVASLLTQERPNVFTQSVANIEPGKRIDIEIRYYNTLTYADGWYEFVFPMVVGPRFNPPGTTDGIGSVPVGGHGTSGQSTEVQYLRPDRRSGHDVALSVALDAGVELEQIECKTHQIEQTAGDDGRVQIRLSAADSIPNRDFVLRYKVAGEDSKSALFVHRDGGEGYFTLMLVPPEYESDLPRRPVEMVFVLDCSGSMYGAPLEQGKDAIRHALRSMREDDTFQIIRFSDNASQMGGIPVPATERNLRQGLRYVNSLDSEGGTYMIEGIKAALDFPHDEDRLRFVTFLTDGYIGNELDIFRAVEQKLGASRIFSFGVGSSVNRYLLDGMAGLGNGAVAYLGLEDDGAEVMDGFFKRISRPALTDLRIDWGGMQVEEVYPGRIPDLFVGRPVILSGRFRGEPHGAIRITGRYGEGTRTMEIPLEARADAGRSVATLWARAKIADLARRSITEPRQDWAGQVKEVALRHGLMSQYTAFVAVDSLTRTAGDHGTTVAVPVPVPAGVRYETTVQEGAPAQHWRP